MLAKTDIFNQDAEHLTAKSRVIKKQIFEKKRPFLQIVMPREKNLTLLISINIKKMNIFQSSMDKFC